MQQTQPQPKARPYKIKGEEPNREIEILENGDVKMKETITNELWFSPREFLTFARSFDKEKAELERSLSDDNVSKVKRRIEELKKQRTPLERFIPEIERKAEERAKRDDLENRMKNFKKMLSMNDALAKIDPKQVEAFWKELSEEDKKAFDEEQKSKILKLLAKAKRKGI